MSEDTDLFNPSRLTIFRRFNELLEEAKDLEDAKSKFETLIVKLVLNKD